jgi:hypothetical protein
MTSVKKDNAKLTLKEVSMNGFRHPRGIMATLLLTTNSETTDNTSSFSTNPYENPKLQKLGML